MIMFASFGILMLKLGLEEGPRGSGIPPPKEGVLKNEMKTGF